MAVLNELEPKEVFRFFEEISAIPRGSRDTKRISDYLVAFAKERDLKVIQDEVNNVIIFQPGTPGYEESEPVILQGHMDMVCEKTSDSTHDFKNDGLELYVEDGFLKAKDTTLGGDDGVAVAMALALMDSEDIPHPPIEAVFTVDEELGMEGAEAIDLSVLKGKKLINLDSEEEKTLTVGCAGGVRYQGLIPVEKETASGEVIKITIQGLLGGHSGEEIHRQRGNANKMMARLLYHIAGEKNYRLSEIYGGSKDNVIAMEAHASILAEPEDCEEILAMIRDMESIWNAEFMGEEPGLTVKTETEKVENIVVFSKNTTQKVVGYLTACPNGLKEYSRKVAGATETSLNLGVVSMKGGSIPDQKCSRQQKAAGAGRSRCCDKSIRRKRFAFQRISGMAVQATVRTPSGHGRSIQRSLWKRAGDLHYPRWTGVWNLPRKTSGSGLRILRTGCSGYSFL